MNAADEEALEAGCAAGDPVAIDTAIGLLDAQQPYTRARASEMLALVPEPVLVERLAATFAAGFPSTLWWRVLALFAEDHDRAPGGPVLFPHVTEAFRSGVVADPDAVFHALRAMAAIRLPGRAALAEPWVTHSDTEVALRAALVVAEERPLTEAEVSRVRSIEGEDRLHALVLLAEQGDRAAVDELVARVPSAGPFAYHVLETVERHGGADVLPALARLWDRRWFGGHVAARAAGAASALGDRRATERLRTLARRALRRDTRAVAWAELARTGNEGDLDRVEAFLASSRPEVAFVVAELWRRNTPRVRGWVERALADGTPDVRAAACDAIAEWPPDEGLTATLRSMTNDRNPGVRAAAAAALAELQRRTPP